MSIRSGCLEAAMIENYARESGVRNLENLIKKISRKAVMEIVRGVKKKIVIHKKDVETYLGKPVFTADEMFETIPGWSPDLPGPVWEAPRFRSKRPRC